MKKVWELPYVVEMVRKGKKVSKHMLYTLRYSGTGASGVEIASTIITGFISTIPVGDTSST